MKIGETYSHLSAFDIISQKPPIYLEIEDTFNDHSLSFARGSTSYMKKQISKGLNNLGWADNIKLGKNKSNLTINFLKSRVGLCFQIGNVSRTYADILKISHLGNEGIIDVGVIVVPFPIESKKLGTNYPNYERLKQEMILFKKIILTPILIIGLVN